MTTSINTLSSQAASSVGSAASTLISSVKNLASGSRINSASDDAAGLAVRQMLRGDVATANQAFRNINDGVSMLQTADGAAATINDNLVRMKALATQASGGIYSADQKAIMQHEFDQLAAENTRIVSDTKFNGVSLFQTGQTIDIATGDGGTISVDTQSLSIASADLVSNPVAAQTSVSDAIVSTTTYRANLGSSVNRLEAAADVISVRAENTLAAESRISDADIAHEVATMTSNRVQTQAAIAAQAHANTVSSVVALFFG